MMSEQGSGNVFADLELEDASELYARAQLRFHAHKLITGRKLKQREIAALLGLKQPEVSHLMNGHFSRFTTDKLLDFLKRLDQKVMIHISPRKSGERYRKVEFVNEVIIRQIKHNHRKTLRQSGGQG